MRTYCVSCKRNTGNKNAKVIKTKKWKIKNEINLFSMW